jgi:hypothetical protein
VASRRDTADGRRRPTRLRLLGALTMLLCLSAIAPSSAAALTIGTCPVDQLRQYHVWGNQYASGKYDGQFGWFVTYNMSVPDWNSSAFSLSHLYTYYGNSSPFLSDTEVEVGYYKGIGNQNYGTPHWYYAWVDHGTYHEHDSTSAPSVGTTYVYEVLFEGHNYNLGTDDWNVYWNGLGTVRGTIHQSSMPYGHALAGGEVQGDSTSWTEMKTHGTPDQEIVLQGYTWKSWTTYFTSTAACQSSGITYKINTNYTDYTATGQA